jgi:hypothetical protein
MVWDSKRRAHIAGSALAAASMYVFYTEYQTAYLLSACTILAKTTLTQFTILLVQDPF